jgi:hypothetical protein
MHVREEKKRCIVRNRDALDELRSLRKKKMESIDEHIAKFKMLAAKSRIDTTNPLTIKLLKETLPWGLTL